MAKKDYSQIKRLCWRFLRSLVSVGFAGIVSYYQDNNYYLAIAPIIAVIGKLLRDKGYDIKVI